MTRRNSNTFDYESVKSSKRKDLPIKNDYASVRAPQNNQEHDQAAGGNGLRNFAAGKSSVAAREKPEIESPKEEIKNPSVPAIEIEATSNPDITYAERQKIVREQRKELRSRKLLSTDNWIARNGHNLTFVGILLFTFFVFFRPYEMIPGGGFLSSGALIIAAATLAVFLPTQFLTEGSPTIFTTEVKCVFGLAALALVTMPIAKSPGMAWETFNDTFIKAVLIFVVMVNVLRTPKRLMAMLWLSFAISIYLSFMSINLYLKGEFKTEGYRVSLDIQGLFANANDMSLHLTTMTPIIIALGIAAKSKLSRLIYFALAMLFVAGNMVTFSRGGFLGLIASTGLLVWKIGRKNRLSVSIGAIIAGGLFILFAPGNYGLRILSIFVPGLDPVGSADMRKESLILSVIVTLRNPWGIGIGNSPIVGHHNLQTHNAYTQVSSEIGLLGLLIYLIFIISPLRKLGAVERLLFARDDSSWIYYLAIGLQASLVAYMVTSFFGSVAYNWYVYYLVAYAVSLRRIYQIAQAENGNEANVETRSLTNYFKLQRA